MGSAARRICPWTARNWSWWKGSRTGCREPSGRPSKTVLERHQENRAVINYVHTYQTQHFITHRRAEEEAEAQTQKQFLLKKEGARFCGSAKRKLFHFAPNIMWKMARARTVRPLNPFFYWNCGAENLARSDVTLLCSIPCSNAVRMEISVSE